MVKQKRTVVVCLILIIATLMVCLVVNIHFGGRYQEFQDFEVSLGSANASFTCEQCEQKFVELKIGPASYLEHCYVKQFTSTNGDHSVTCRCWFREKTVLNAIKGMFVKGE